MADYSCTYLPGCVIGVMPCGEERMFVTESEYCEAYRDEENEIVDELARLEALRELDFPEDYSFMIA